MEIKSNLVFQVVRFFSPPHLFSRNRHRDGRKKWKEYLYKETRSYCKARTILQWLMLQGITE